jgi:SAM-dependent methyltransferase
MSEDRNRETAGARQRALATMDEMALALSKIDKTAESDGELAAYGAMESRFDDLESTLGTLDQADRGAMQSYFGRNLNPLFELAELPAYAARVRGTGHFVGDAEMMEKIDAGHSRLLYAPPRRSLGLADYIDRLLLSLRNSRANVLRKDFFAQFLMRVSTGARVGSIGSGGALELRVAAAAVHMKAIEVHLFDQDARANALALRELGKLGLTPIIHPGNVLRSVLECETGTYDILYLSGLLDYIRERSAERLLRFLYRCLAPAGILIVTNACVGCPRVPSEFIMNWHLDLKTPETMLAMASQLPDAHVQLLTDGLGVYQYLVVERAARSTASSSRDGAAAELPVWALTARRLELQHSL